MALWSKELLQVSQQALCDFMNMDLFFDFIIDINLRSKIHSFINSDGSVNTDVVDIKVVNESVQVS